MKRPRIFISYRRDQNTIHAGWIHDRLTREFGKGSVFLDHSIEPGEDFVQVLIEKLNSCDILLAVIGRSWLNVTDSSGRSRIHSPEDFVAFEIREALHRNVHVIPILVDGGRMPGRNDLPEDLVSLAFRQAYELPDRDFLSALEKLFPTLQASRSFASEGRSSASSVASAILRALQTAPKTKPKDQPPRIGISVSHEGYKGDRRTRERRLDRPETRLRYGLWFSYYVAKGHEKFEPVSPNADNLVELKTVLLKETARYRFIENLTKANVEPASALEEACERVWQKMERKPLGAIFVIEAIASELCVVHQLSMIDRRVTS